MTSANDFSDKVKNLLSFAQIEFPIVNARLAVTALSLVRNRIINDGVNSKGNSLGKYSQNPLPTYFFSGKSISAGGDKGVKAYEKANRKLGINGVSYEQFRDANNLQTNHVDLKVSGDTWRDIDVLETFNEGGKIITLVASKNSISRKNGKGTIKTGEITEFLGERYGDFLQLNETETEILEEALDAEVQNLVDTIFGR